MVSHRPGQQQQVPHAPPPDDHVASSSSSSAPLAPQVLPQGAGHRTGQAAPAASRASGELVQHRADRRALARGDALLARGGALREPLGRGEGKAEEDGGKDSFPRHF